MFDIGSDATSLVIDVSSVSLPVSLLPITLIQVLTELHQNVDKGANSLASVVFERCISLLTNPSSPPKPATAAVLFGIVVEIKNKNLLQEQSLNKANISEPLRKFLSG